MADIKKWFAEQYQELGKSRKRNKILAYVCEIVATLGLCGAMAFSRAEGYSEGATKVFEATEEAIDRSERDNE